MLLAHHTRRAHMQEVVNLSGTGWDRCTLFVSQQSDRDIGLLRDARSSTGLSRTLQLLGQRDLRRSDSHKVHVHGADSVLVRMFLAKHVQCVSASSLLQHLRERVAMRARMNASVRQEGSATTPAAPAAKPPRHGGGLVGRLDEGAPAADGEPLQPAGPMAPPQVVVRPGAPREALAAHLPRPASLDVLARSGTSCGMVSIVDLSGACTGFTGASAAMAWGLGRCLAVVGAPPGPASGLRSRHPSPRDVQNGDEAHPHLVDEADLPLQAIRREQPSLARRHLAVHARTGPGARR